MSLAFNASSQEAKWLTDFTKAAALAKTQNKPVLLDFTGSDWCGWCIKMKKETLDAAQFKKYAEQNLILVEVDFPNSKPQTEKVKKQNEELKTQYQVEGFPTFVLLDKDGHKLGEQTGYVPGGPEAFIAWVSSLTKQ